MIEIPAALAAFALSFLGLGFLWIGKLGGEAIVAALYLWLWVPSRNCRKSAGVNMHFLASPCSSDRRL